MKEAAVTALWTNLQGLRQQVEHTAHLLHSYYCIFFSHTAFLALVDWPKILSSNIGIHLVACLLLQYMHNDSGCKRFRSDQAWIWRLVLQHSLSLGQALDCAPYNDHPKIRGVNNSNWPHSEVGPRWQLYNIRFKRFGLKGPCCQFPAEMPIAALLGLEW